MTETNDATGSTDPVRPLIPVAIERDAVAFHEPVPSPTSRSLAVRLGIVAGSALLVVVGVAAVMGASPSPTTGAGPLATTTPDASTAPGAGGAPGTGRGPWAGAMGGPMGGFGSRGGPGFGFGGIGLGGITISTIDGSNVSLKTDDGWTRTITVTTDTKITKGGATIAAGDLAVGDHVRIGETRAADGTYTVTAIGVVLPTVAGQVTAIDGDTLTITLPGGTTAKVHVAPGTTYQVDGSAGALSDIKVGGFIVAQGTQRSDGSLDAATVHSGFGGKGGLGRPGFPNGPHDQDGPKVSPAPSSNAG